MGVQWSNYVVDRYLAPDLSKFTACEIPDLRPKYPQAPSWLANHFLNSVFTAELAGDMRVFAVNLMLRAYTSFAAYHDARDLTMRFIAESGPGSPSGAVYFKAITTWEACFVNHQIFADVFSAAYGKKRFAPGDKSPIQRAYDIANVVKHWGKEVQRGGHQQDDTIPMWLSNDGFLTRSLALTYVEAAELMDDMAGAADLLQNPSELPGARVTPRSR